MANDSKEPRWKKLEKSNLMIVANEILVYGITSR